MEGKGNGDVIPHEEYPVIVWCVKAKLENHGRARHRQSRKTSRMQVFQRVKSTGEATVRIYRSWWPWGQSKRVKVFVMTICLMW